MALGGGQVGAARGVVAGVRLDMGPDHRPDREHEGQGGQALAQPRALAAGGLVQPGVQHPAGGVAPSPEVEVHQQEGEVVLDVDVRQPVIELDAVEEDRSPALQEDVA